MLKRYIFDELKTFADEKKLCFGYATNKGEEKVVWFYKPEWKYYSIMVYTEKENNWGPMHYGVVCYEKPKRNEDIRASERIQLDCLKERTSSEYPYGSSCLAEEYQFWTNDIVESIINGKLANHIKRCVCEVLSEIETKNIKMP